MIAMQTYPLTRRLGDEAALQLLADAGFEGIDYSMHAYSLEDPLYDMRRQQIAARYRALGAQMRALGLTACQLHALYPTYTGRPLEDERRFRALLCALWAAQTLGCPYVVVHPALLAASCEERDRQAAWAKSRILFTRLMPVLRECNLKVGIENMFLFSQGRYRPTPISTARDLAEYADRLNDIAGEERFVACLDTGHAHLLGLDVARMPRELGSRLRLLHLHDNLRTGDDHTAPYLGSIDWDAFTDALADSGYEGALSLEAHGFAGAYPPELMPAALKLLEQTARRLENRMRQRKA